MSNLINREDALRFTNPEDWGTPDERWRPESEYGRYIQSLPPAEPEIVRCKDCKHRDAETAFCEGRGWPMQLVPDDGFCDKGERSEEV